jgi:hypothetical protein
MTEQWWLTRADPNRMLKYLRANDRLSERKDILFGAACCHRILHLVGTWGPSALDAVERFAEAPSDQLDVRMALYDVLFPATELLRETNTAAERLPKGAEEERDLLLAKHHAAMAFICLPDVTLNPVTMRAWMAQAVQATRAGRRRESAAQAALLRDIAGNPFQPASLDPAWLTPAVLKLAQAAYGNRVLPSGLLDNAGLAILADALEEAGCDNTYILSHLRGPGPHVRGCWAVDLVLGKK